VLDASRDLAKMAAQIEQLNERDVEGYLSYLAYAARIHRITGPVFIYNKPPKLWDILSVPLSEMPHVDPMRTMNGAINSFVKHPHLRQLLGRFATYTGASPYQAPATLNVIAHVELTGGVWYPQGGIYAIANALEKLAAELGVQIHTGCPVEQIVVDSETVVGITLPSDHTVTADAVIANLDVAMVYEKLLPDHIATPQRQKQLTSLEPSCSGFIMLLGVEARHEQLAHHNIFFSPDYPAEFQDIFERGVPPEDPTIMYPSPVKQTRITRQTAAKTGLCWSMPHHWERGTTGQHIWTPIVNWSSLNSQNTATMFVIKFGLSTYSPLWTLND
jgi:phytoene desaturase